MKATSLRARDLGVVATVTVTSLGTAGIAATLAFDVASQFTNEPCLDFAPAARWFQLTAAATAVVAATGSAWANRISVAAEGHPRMRRVLLRDGAAAFGAAAWVLRFRYDGCVPATSVTFALTLIAATLWLASLVESDRRSTSWAGTIAGETSLGMTALAAAADVVSHPAAPSSWPRASFWLVVLALVTTVVTLAVHAASPDVERPTGRPICSAVVAAALLAASLLVRSGSDYTEPTNVLASVLVAAALAVGMFSLIRPRPVD